MMAILTVRNVPDDVHRALRAQAARNGRSTEAEVREILASAVKPVDRLGMGDALAAIGRQAGLSNEDVATMDQAPDRMPADPLRFEP